MLKKYGWSDGESAPVIAGGNLIRALPGAVENVLLVKGSGPARIDAMAA